MQAADDFVLPHHEAAARLWSLGGAGYDKVSYAISDALAHASQRLAPKPGEQALEVATGTGWVARNLASFGTQVTAVDISSGLLEAARALSAHLQPAINFEIADAEKLPFDDASYEKVISTFGVMFAQHHQAAASELARVCKPGGRLVITTWEPDGSVAEFFGIIGKYRDAPPPKESPLAWGDPDYIRKLLGDDFELTFERGVSNSYYDSVNDIWQGMVEGFGPVRELVDSLDESHLAGFRKDIDDYHGKYTTEDGLLHIKREYLLTLAHRK